MKAANIHCAHKIPVHHDPISSTRVKRLLFHQCGHTHRSATRQSVSVNRRVSSLSTVPQAEGLSGACSSAHCQFPALWRFLENCFLFFKFFAAVLLSQSEDWGFLCGRDGVLSWINLRTEDCGKRILKSQRIVGNKSVSPHSVSSSLGLLSLVREKNKAVFLAFISTRSLPLPLSTALV